ncbi:MAG: carbohydrate kinase family protein, partial [Enterocloster sp.]|nr:carbohydrate kinase family protein [Enterocloster sp.]
LLRRAKAHGRMTVMDAAFNQRSVCNCWMNMFKEVLPYTDVFFPSYEEASAITGCREIPEISSALKPMGLTYFGIKLGSKGCYVTDFSEERYIECPKGIRAVDTTGAGDSFMAGLMAGLVSGLSFFESAGFGCSVASHSVQHMGAAGGILPYEDELYLYNHHKNQK